MSHLTVHGIRRISTPHGKTLVDDIGSYPRTEFWAVCYDGSLTMFSAVNLGEFMRTSQCSIVVMKCDPSQLPTIVSSVGASCFVSNNQIIILVAMRPVLITNLTHPHAKIRWRPWIWRRDRNGPR